MAEGGAAKSPPYLRQELPGIEFNLHYHPCFLPSWSKGSKGKEKTRLAERLAKPYIPLNLCREVRPGGHYPSMHPALVFNDEEYQELLRQVHDEKAKKAEALVSPEIVREMEKDEK